MDSIVNRLHKGVFIMRVAIAVLLATVSFLLSLALPLQAQDADGCPVNFPARLVGGEWAWSIAEGGQNLRAEPTVQAERMALIPNNDILRVLEDSTCADGYRWWPVAYAGLSGWTVEGNPADGRYWLEALTEPQLPVSTPVDDEAEGCLTPPELYQQIQIGYGTLNLRTVAMLDQAQVLYTTEGGTQRFRNAVMQGGYNPGGVSASFGTHDGGGAVDLSVRELGTGRVLYDEIPWMLRALRRAGFAAWLRDTGQLYAGSPIHIHAIAVGDAELSPAARDQIDGPLGYLRGFNGLPEGYGGPALDDGGAMVVCPWMIEAGFPDLREAPAAVG
jgi:hypothetical protein